MGRQAVQCPWNFADRCWTRAPGHRTRLFHGLGCGVRHGSRSWDSRHGPQSHHRCSPARQPRKGLELVAFFLCYRNRDHSPGGYARFSIGYRMAHDFPDFYNRSATCSSRIPQRRSAPARLGQRRRTDTTARSLSQFFFRGCQCGDLSWRRFGVGAGTMAARLRPDESWFLKIDRQCFVACLLGCHGAGSHLCRTDRWSS